MRHWKYYRYSEVVKMRLWLLHDRIKSLSAHKEFAKMRQSEFDIARRYWDGNMKSRPYKEFPKNIKNLT